MAETKSAYNKLHTVATIGIHRYFITFFPAVGANCHCTRFHIDAFDRKFFGGKDGGI